MANLNTLDPTAITSEEALFAARYTKTSRLDLL